MTDGIPLLTLDDLRARGLPSRRVAAEAAGGSLVRLRRGIYVDAARWRSAYPEQRIVARAHALAAVSARRPVFAYETALALLGQPLYRASHDRVHVIADADRTGPAHGVVRHRGEPDHDVVEVAGLLCTNLARSVADVARTASFEQAATSADAALHTLFAPRDGAYDLSGAGEFRECVRGIARTRAHGIRRAERVLDFADGRAHLPGETISRIRLVELGFRRIRLQAAVPSPSGSYFVDFALDDADAFGEFDGTIKYQDGGMLDGRSRADVFDAEKQREDWIRGTTQRRLARWGWPHVATAAALGERLGAFGIHPPR
ncbi:hypothetical protein NQ166_04205 [Microbacterium sp. zg.Y1090]|uniref:hypothetical protein n=1 Tax=Microbacterium TaxID=33882 RepID=UPI00214CF08D|nr:MULTISPECIES: hypothetical protein [unclassified Microbacterium]MCR2813634.1 hypothetical protein [Microbacterium sp. zg.Y1084]MCR2818033.1 hypothetical protein [Microbacterium sp. zg.Y1090]MDL5486551.1 hypothetical protein [Microbacterium sp. zg-Y1211]WIM27808.1 hypothetical protein QNO26_11710 [Microbacterium sp. zg-Y1090]